MVIGVASTAPAYSLAASLGYVVITANGDGIVGVKAPAIMLLAFIPMYCHRRRLRGARTRPSPTAAPRSPGRRARSGPKIGWMGGWGIIVADIIVMANLAQIAGSYTFLLFGVGHLAESVFWSTVAGVIWIAVMTYICYRGHRAVGPDPVRPARHRARRAADLRGSIALVKVVRRQRRPAAT